MYECFEHTADLGLRVRAASLNQLFADAAKGLLAVLVANPDEIRSVQEVTYDLSGESLDLLLFDWLSELLYTFESRRLLFSSFVVRVDATRLTASCCGEEMDTARHQMDHEIKAITYHGLRLERENDGYLAEVILDI